MKTRIEWVQKPTQKLSIRSKCRLLKVSRHHQYYVPKPADESDVTLMNEIQDIYEKRPFQGYKRLTDDLKDMGHAINHKRVYRLMKELGIQAVYPKKNLSKRRFEDTVVTYLLKDYPPQKPHDCWCTDLTYIKTSKGFVYLTALIDVVSRYVMGWSLSPFLDTENCLDALEMALKTGYKPKIINTDQGCQYTSQEWKYALSLCGITLSMDGKGRCLDNIPIERFWRTIKYEEVYLKTYESVCEARVSISTYIDWYNTRRRHSALNKARPIDVMTGQITAVMWPFQKGHGIVENPIGFTHSSTPTTSITRNKNNQLMKPNLSSTFVA